MDRLPPTCHLYMWRYFRAHPSKGPPAHGQTTTNLPVLPPTTPGRVPNPTSISCAHTYLASDVDLAPLGALRGRRSVNLAARTGVRNLECCAGLGGGGGGKDARPFAALSHCVGTQTPAGCRQACAQRIARIDGAPWEGAAHGGRGRRGPGSRTLTILSFHVGGSS
jgi:hypothetical protein